MAKWGILALGVIWPFVVALLGVAVIATGHQISDAEFYFLFLATLPSVPAIFAVVVFRLPHWWSDTLRAVAAIVLTAPTFVVELWIALVLLAVGANWTGHGWIE